MTHNVLIAEMLLGLNIYGWYTVLQLLFFACLAIWGIILHGLIKSIIIVLY